MCRREVGGWGRGSVVHPLTLCCHTQMILDNKTRSWASVHLWYQRPRLLVRQRERVFFFLISSKWTSVDVGLYFGVLSCPPPKKNGKDEEVGAEEEVEKTAENKRRNETKRNVKRRCLWLKTLERTPPTDSSEGGVFFFFSPALLFKAHTAHPALAVMAYFSRLYIQWIKYTLHPRLLMTPRGAH